MIWLERGGRGAPQYLLLHGLGATAGVWHGVCAALDQCEAGSWIVCDLPGHGASDALADYSIGALAAVIAASLERDRPYRVISHSLGVYLGLALASEWFGVRIESLLGLGPKVTWLDAEVTSMLELARKPPREFATEDEAWARYRRISGLDARIAPEPETIARGVRANGGSYRLAADSRTPLVTGAPFATLFASARCPVLLTRGERDTMVTLDELRAYCPQALDLPNTGHNAHVEAPAELVALDRRWRAGKL